MFDDTDQATVENVAGVYSLLADLGFHTTKSCWVASGDRNQGRFPGHTLDDSNYRQWLLDLQSQGFEVGWHARTWHSSDRDQTAAALERFAQVFGHDPAVATNHTGTREAIYWGSQRVTGWRRLLYNLLTQYRNSQISLGSQPGSDYFWGDLCQKKIKYFRNFVFQEINTLDACPFMPYRDPAQPYVNYWFASTNGCDVQTFNRCLSEQEQDRLEAEGGACIMYTHFARGFLNHGKPDPRFQQLMTRLAKKNGWFVPVNTLLDHLLKINGPHLITDAQRKRLERKWLLEKLFVGKT